METKAKSINQAKSLKKSSAFEWIPAAGSTAAGMIYNVR